MNPHPAEISHALLDVRKAYRLLHDYQRAALDAVSYIGSQLGFTYAGGYANFSACTPRDGKGDLDSWAWDWLNLYFHDFHFYKNQPGTDALNLSIWLISDTGFFESKHPSPDETDITTFARAEESGTKIGFVLYRQWKEEYDFIGDSEAVRTFLETGGQLPPRLHEAGIRAMVRDFSCVAGPDSTDGLLAELVHFANANGFPLGRMQVLDKQS